MRLGDTPVLIPNTMVKTQAADGTILETVWESRWLPDLFKKIAEKRLNKYWFYQWLEIETKFWFLMTDKLQSERTLKTAYWIKDLRYIFKIQDIRGISKDMQTEKCKQTARGATLCTFVSEPFPRRRDIWLS